MNHWVDIPDHGADEWQEEVSEGSTRLGYLDWAEARGWTGRPKRPVYIRVHVLGDNVDDIACSVPGAKAVLVDESNIEAGDIRPDPRLDTAWDYPVSALGDDELPHWDSQYGVYTPDDCHERYVAYCAAHGRTPDAQGARDRNRWPGGCMTGYIMWIQRHHLAFAAAHPEWAARGGPTFNQEAFTTYLRGLPRESHEE